MSTEQQLAVMQLYESLQANDLFERCFMSAYSNKSFSYSGPKCYFTVVLSAGGAEMKLEGRGDTLYEAAMKLRGMLLTTAAGSQIREATPMLEGITAR